MKEAKTYPKKHYKDEFINKKFKQQVSQEERRLAKEDVKVIIDEVKDILNMFDKKQPIYSNWAFTIYDDGSIGYKVAGANDRDVIVSLAKELAELKGKLEVE